MTRLFVAWVLTVSATTALAADPAPAKTTPPNPGAPRPATTPGAHANTPGATHPGATGGGKKEEGPKPPSITLNYATPAVMPFSSFPTVELRAPNSATYFGLQFGTGKEEVVYYCFDAEDGQKIHDRAWWYIPGGTNPPKPLLEKAQDEKIKPAKNVKTPKEKPQRFEFPPLHSRIGDAEILSKVSAIYGHQQKASLLLDIDVVVKEPKAKYAFNLKGGAIDIAVPMPNEIKVIPLLSQPKLEVYEYLRVNPPWIRPYLSMTNRFLVQPLSGMEDVFTVQIKNKEDGKVVDKGRQPIKVPEYSFIGESGAGLNYPLKGLKAGSAYDIETSINLGPFGQLSETTKLSMPGKVKN